MTCYISLHTSFHHLLEKNEKKKQRNRQSQKVQIQHEQEVIKFLVDSKWNMLIVGIDCIQMDKTEVKELVKQMYAESSSLLSYFNKHQLLMKIIKFGNKSLNRTVALPDPIYLLPHNTPLLNEYDFIELAAFRMLETKFEESIVRLDKLSADERVGQILFSSIAYGALFNSWKQNALMESTRAQWIVEKFAIWVELKSLKPSLKNKSLDDFCDDDYKIARWFPDCRTELLILRWFKDFPNRDDFKGTLRSLQSFLFAFLRKSGVLKEDMPDSLALFSCWASHSLALEIPPYMHSISYDKPLVTHVSSESWFRMYSGKEVLKCKPKSVSKHYTADMKYSIHQNLGLVPISEQRDYINRIHHKISAAKMTRIQCVNYIREQLDNPASFIAWLIAAFSLNLIMHGGLEKKKLELSTVYRYLGAIKTPLLNTFANVDTSTISENEWLFHLQQAIDDHSYDQTSKNRIIEFAQFIIQLDEIPDIDIHELEGVTIHKRVNANLVSQKEFEKALAKIVYGGRVERMCRIAAVFGFYLGLRRGETLHLLLKDIAGQASPELLVRSNTHRNTKNRTSRRLPLSALIPAPLFYEFMLYYHERVEEENGKLGNKLLFCNTNNSTTPLTDKELLQPIVNVLKSVTGDQTLVYHSLRHSFANNTFLRLLIPEFPQIICSGIKMFEYEGFSMRSCMKFRHRLLPGVEKDVRLSVRDTLYQLVMFMGHASPETTIKSYLHMFDWIIHRSLPTGVESFSDEHIRSLLDESSKYWFELKKEFTENIKGGSLNPEKVVAYARKKFTSEFSNPAKKKTLKKRHSSNKPTVRVLQPEDLIQLLPMFFQKILTIEEISERLNVSPENIIQIKENAEALHQIKTRTGQSRLQLVLPPLKGKQQHKDFKRILEKYKTLRKNDRTLSWFLKKFIHGSPTTGMEVKFGTESEVNLYIALLRKLGIPKTRIILWFYPDSRSSDIELQRIIHAWAVTTGILTERILKKPSPRSKISQDPRRRRGWVSVFVCENKDNFQKSSGVQQAFHLLAVFNGKDLLNPDEIHT